MNDAKNAIYVAMVEEVMQCIGLGRIGVIGKIKEVSSVYTIFLCRHLNKILE